jgi:hypothetical protein
MKGIIERFVIARLKAAGTYPTKMTKKTELEDLVAKLRPRQPDRSVIRLGPAADGGYLVPDDLDGITACYSPGVANISGFEKDCAEQGIRVYMADYSVHGPAASHELFDFTKKFLGVVEDECRMTLDSWVDSTAGDNTSDLLLQMDIEGAEYEVLLGASDRLLRRFRIIVAEFHDLHLLRSRPFFGLASKCFEKLLQTHSCVHIHPNNCCGSESVEGLEIPCVAEFTFLRDDRISALVYADEFPHPLDADNTDNEPLPLPEWWYRPKSAG